MRLGTILLRLFLCSFILNLALVPQVGLFNSDLLQRPPELSDSDFQQMIVRIKYRNIEEFSELINTLDVWEVHHDQSYIIALVSQEKLINLKESGKLVEVDYRRTSQINNRMIYSNGQVHGIPGYSCYRTVEETYQDLVQLTLDSPNLATMIDIGDSWEKIVTDGSFGYDLKVIKITNSIMPGPKPTLFLIATIHAREYTTGESAIRFAEYLVNNYNNLAEIHWLLDYSEVHILAIANPDGRKIAETGVYWRKNTDNDDGCTDSQRWGTDINRNFSFKWSVTGSSFNPCDETYHGPLFASEPETSSVQSYARTLFSDQRGDSDYDPAPLTKSGVVVSLHSYGELILWPWGWSSNQSPNHAHLKELGDKFAYYLDYTPQQASQLYPVSGSTDDYTYGELGVASYAFELGTMFFQDCETFEAEIYPDLQSTLVYAIKSTRLPYINPAGPEVTEIHLDKKEVNRGEHINVEAIANSSLTYSNDSQGFISGVNYTLDSPSWITDTISFEMESMDGEFNSQVERAIASIDTTTLAIGRHILLVEGQINYDTWGVPSAEFFSVVENWPPGTAHRYFLPQIYHSVSK